MSSVVGFSEVSAEELRDDTWVDLFGWLDSYESADAAHLERLVPGVADWWIADSPRMTCAEVQLGELIPALARLIVRRHRTTPLGDLVPTLDHSMPLASLRLGPRAETVVRRLATRGFVAALLDTDVDALLARRGTSVETVALIVAGLLGAAISVEPARDVPADDDTANPAAEQIIDDLATLSRWQRLRGRLQAPLIGVSVEDDAPEVVQDAAARIAAVTAHDFDTHVQSSPIDEIENLVEQLDEREDIVLRAYVMAATPITMGELSSRLHVSKSRAGVIAARVKNAFTQACGFDTAVGGLLAGIRAEIEPVAPLRRLLALHPILDQPVGSLGVPLWLALDRLDDCFEVTGRWAAAPTVGAAKGRTITMLEQFESDNGAVRMSAAATVLGLTEPETRDWLGCCGLSLVGEHVLLATRRIVDHSAGILEALGRPLTTAELIDVLERTKPEVSVERALLGDDRLELRDGRWRLRLPVPAGGTGQPDAVGSRNDKDIRRTRRLYRVGDTWCFRVVVSADHLRGSGLTIPSGVAIAFGCRPGTTREIPGSLGSQTLRWTGVTPTCSSIRRYLVELGSEPKDVVFLTFSDVGGFNVAASSPARPDDPLRSALSLIGHRRPDDLDEDEAIGALATAVGLPVDTKPRRILSTYQARDGLVADLLEACWVVARDG